MPSIVMVHTNPVQVRSGRVRVDRKFHLGMERYAAHIGRPIRTINPNLRDGQPIMDAVELPLASLPYEIINVDVDPSGLHLRAGDELRVSESIANCEIVYGTGLGSARIAQRMCVPYIQILEYDLDTQLRIISAETNGTARRLIRSVRCVSNYFLESVPDMRRAHSLHCNGFPIFDATQSYNASRLLYFDSRMKSEDIITEAALKERLASAARRPLRLLYSGRYERIKGADDVVRIAARCLRIGLDIQLDCYGQGSLRAQMERLSQGLPQIRVHGPIPYPELVKISHSADVFVCCHIQNDPSCTYIESMGAGLPIVGYGNRMWRRLRDSSDAGMTAPLGSVSAMVKLIGSLLLDREKLDRFSWNARTFATDHSFECEFGKRIEALRSALNSA